MKVHIQESRLRAIAPFTHETIKVKEFFGSKSPTIKQRTRFFEVSFGLTNGTKKSVNSVCLSRYWVSIKDIPIVEADALNTWLKNEAITG